MVEVVCQGFSIKETTPHKVAKEVNNNDEST
jgi:hypothetical protein